MNPFCALEEGKDGRPRNASARTEKEFTHAIDRMAAGEYVDTIDEGKQIDIAELEYIHQNKPVAHQGILQHPSPATEQRPGLNKKL